MRAKGLNAVITAGGSGLGAAAARRLAREGARVVVSDIDLQRARAVAHEIDPTEQIAMATQCDISEPEDCQRLIAESEQFFGRHIDIFLANAGKGFAGSLLEATPAEIKKTIDINVTGSIISAQEALRSLVKGPNGVLIFTCSLQGVTARPMRSVYTASKHALVGLIKGLALEFGPRGVRVNAIAPASTDTAFLRKQLATFSDQVEEALSAVTKSMPLGHLPSTEDFADAVMFLASREAQSITGHTLMLDCGASAGKL
ncbi:MAG TPA: SDR family oxidoreductase [Eoetvoesiella sp.]